MRVTPIGLLLITLFTSTFFGVADEVEKGGHIPELVDRRGNPRDFRIEGAIEIQETELQDALINSAEYIMASHPAADFATLLEVMESGLLRAYQKAGFATPEVKVSWDRETSEVVVKLVEGPRYRLGEIKIIGNKKISGERIERRLMPEDAVKDQSMLRADAAMDGILKEKVIQDAVVKEALEKAFPKESENEFNAFELVYLFNYEEFREGMAVWEKGKWVRYQPHYLETAEVLVRSVYADEGLFSSEIAIEITPREGADGIADLEVKIISEGQPTELDEIYVSGNRVNTREEILDFLELGEGISLEGAWLDRVNRKLFESGRFLGWKLIPKSLKNEPEKIGLLIIVEEEWEAPPLSAPLGPEQQALLRAAGWVNTKLGEDGDLVLSLTFEGGDEAFELSAAFNHEQLAFAWNGIGHDIAAIIPKSGELALRVEAGDRSFFSSFPSESGDFRAFFKLTNSPQEDPYAKTGGIDFGLGIGSSPEKETTALNVLIDPALALMMHRGGDVAAPRIVDGELVLLIKGIEFRFQAATGRLISLENVDENLGFRLTGKIETGAVDRMRARLLEHSEGLENWSEGKARSSLAYLAFFFGVELYRILEDGVQDLTFAQLTKQAAERARRWDSMVIFLGEVTSSVIDTITTAEGEGPLGEEFKIPSLFAKEAGYSTGGQFTQIALGLGLFDGIMEFLEPGSWPDRVFREALFIMDGDSRYFNLTLPILVKDESMGPLGCLICAKLLHLLDHPAAEAFVRKAEGELNLAGFEKDWRVFLGGTAGEGRLGWELLKAFQHVKEEDLYELFGDEKSAMIAPLVDLAKRAGTVRPDTKAEELRPIIDVLWEYGIGDLMKEQVRRSKKKVLNKWDPKLLAAVVNGRPVYRGAIRYAELLGEGGVNQYGLNPVEREVTNLLAASEIAEPKGKLGGGVFQEGARVVLENTGGIKKAEGLGFTQKQLSTWIGISLLANMRYKELAKSGGIPPDELRNFFNKDPFLQGMMETHVHTIQLNLSDSGNDERRLAKEIRDRVLQTGPDVGAMRIAFEKEAAKHSQDDFKILGGRRGWVPDGKLGQKISASLAKVKDGSLSQIFEHVSNGERSVLLILVTEPRRKISFESAKDIALFRAYREKLLEGAVVDILDDPSNEVGAGEGALTSIENLLQVIAPELASRKMTEAEEKKNETNYLENLPIQNQVLIRARTGKRDDIFLLGTYAERGVSPSENSLEEAIRLYRKAAEKGHDGAMIRLAELYRLGRGVEKDESKAKEWREKATTAFQKN
ncbi:hypothetical protein N9195_00640 [bacterium]|nr:hypothetical protein [bacterium]